MRLRPATVEDADQLAALVEAAAGALNAYLLGSAHHPPIDYIRSALQHPGGILGHRHLKVIAIDEKVVGCLALYPARSQRRIFLETGLKLLRYYGLFGGCTRILRSLRLLPMLPSTPSDALVLAHCALLPENRGCGHFRAALETALSACSEHGCRELSLDVAMTNTDAIAVYRALGFTVAETRPSVVPALPGLLRMVRPL